MTSVNAVVQKESSGLYDYTYTVAVSSTSTFPLSAFILDVDTAANLTSISGPTGWTPSYSPGDGVVNWVSPTSSTDTPIGDSAVFSFLSALPSGSQNYVAVGKIDDTLDFNFGTTVGPTALPSTGVPEPASFILALFGLPAVFCMKRRRRTQQESMLVDSTC